MADPLSSPPQRRGHLLSSGFSDVELHRRRRDGTLLSIVPGAYMAASDWAHLEPIEQHRLRVLETIERMRVQPILSHYAAAAVWGIRILQTWPATIDVTQARTSGGRSSGIIRRHTRDLRGVDVVEHEGLVLTSVAQTVVDIARSLPLAAAAVPMDSALHRKRMPGPLTDLAAIAERVDRIAGQPGHRRALAAACFATDLSDSVEESHSRAQIHLLGFPAPVLQTRFRLPDGRDADLDFHWPDFQHGGECDGRDKYSNPLFLRGRSPQQAVMDEKARENQLRRVVPRLSRWEPSELYPPVQLYDRLVRDGLPSSMSRPRAAALGVRG